jgi:hypothetical protein
MVGPIQEAPICLSLEEVTVCAGLEVFMKVDNIILMIVGNWRGILDQKLRPRPIHLLNIITIIILIYDIKL